MSRTKPFFNRTREPSATGITFNPAGIGRALALSALLLLAGGLLPPATAVRAAESEPAPASETVNINKADAAALAAGLNGVGLSRAEEIVRYREAYGPFKSVEELLDVKGIGAATVEKNRPVITLE